MYTHLIIISFDSEVVKIWEGIIARPCSESGVIQSLYTHSKNVAEISRSVSHYPNTSELIAYLHDLGKISSDFQNYIKFGGERGSVIHAWQGAFFANELQANNTFSELLLKEVIGLCVSAHHNHLDDCLSPGGDTIYFDKFSNKDDNKYSYAEIKSKITQQEKSQLQVMFNNATSEIDMLLNKIKETYKDKYSANFAVGLFIKYLFSCLIDADRLDAYLFEIGKSYSYQNRDWDKLIDVFENNIANFPKSKKIAKIRKSISDKCKNAAEKPPGIYQLSVPTGGGKTLSSLRFALHHCKKYNKKRIIYVIPYLSIIEQTAQSIKDIFNLPKDNDLILEHHSNIIEPEDASSAKIRKLSSSRWDNPIIITTMVQFLNSIMSSKSSKLRKFSSMADSVIIFDEVQSMPIKVIHCFNEIVSFLSKILNSTVILCSATQPILESTQRQNLLIQDKAKLINCDEDFKDIKRVIVSAESEMNCESASEFVFEKANINGNCLVIVNTKKSAFMIYNQLKNKPSDFKIVHLSTSMCPCHRIDTINEIKECIENKKKIICISTQLIEAGVDISFACVIRAMSGLDSIAQAAGRCNRNGESISPKTVYTFSLKDENLDKLTDIKSGKEITEEIISSKKKDIDLLDESIMMTFYEKYFNGKGKQMDYPTKDGGWIYHMLSGNKGGRGNYRNKTGNDLPHLISYAFHSADKNFNVIEDNTQSVVVFYKDAKAIIEKYRNMFADIVTEEKMKMLKELQRYSVSLYEWQLAELSKQGALDKLDEQTGVILLNEDFYSLETGVVLNPVRKDLIV